LPITDEPFAAIIRCTAEPAKVDKRTRSKWSRVLRYAAEYKPSSEPLAALYSFTRCHKRRGAKLFTLTIPVFDRQPNC
jgi:hypothetical protein